MLHNFIQNLIGKPENFMLTTRGDDWEETVSKRPFQSVDSQKTELISPVGICIH